MTANDKVLDTSYADLHLVATRPTANIYGQKAVGLEFLNGNARVSISIAGDADDRRAFASRLRELADEIDAWRPR